LTQGKAEELEARLESAEADGSSLHSELNTRRDALAAAAAETARLSIQAIALPSTDLNKHRA
jgi:hypothetical protein